MFFDAKIFVIKEEGDMSHLNQTYDQLVAKSDKTELRKLLGMCRFKIGVIGQYQLIVICIKALLHVKPDDWVRSFTKVNLHPHF